MIELQECNIKILETIKLKWFGFTISYKKEIEDPRLTPNRKTINKIDR